MLSGKTLSHYTLICVRRSQITAGEWVVMGRNRSGFDTVLARCYYKTQAHNHAIMLRERKRSYLNSVKRRIDGCHRSPDESSPSTPH